MPSITCQHKSNSAVRAAGVGSTFLISDSDREITCCVSWEVLYVDKLTSYHFYALFAATGGRQQRITTLLLYLWPHDFGSARPDTELCQKVWTEVYFVKTWLSETAPVKELKKTVCRNFWRLFERIAQYKFQLAETFRTVRERNLEHLSPRIWWPQTVLWKV